MRLFFRYFQGFCLSCSNFLSISSPLQIIPYPSSSASLPSRFLQPVLVSIYFLLLLHCDGTHWCPNLIPLTPPTPLIICLLILFQANLLRLGKYSKNFQFEVQQQLLWLYICIGVNLCEHYFFYLTCVLTTGIIRCIITYTIHSDID